MQGLWNLIGKVGQGSSQAFPYEIGEKVPGLDGKSIWTLHKGKKKVRLNGMIFNFMSLMLSCEPEYYVIA